MSENNELTLKETLEKVVRSEAMSIGGGFRDEVARELGYRYDENFREDEDDEPGAWLDSDGDPVDIDDDGYPEDIANDQSWASRYIEDNVLEMLTIANEDGNYVGSILVLGTGGPHIELNTREGHIEGIWGSQRVIWSYRDDLGVEDYLEEMFS